MSISALIVDDQPDVRRLLSLRIARSGRGVVVGGEAASGSEALANLDQVDPAVIVLDECMPGMSGLETAQRILERRPQQRILLLSAFVDDDLKERARAVGVTLCLSKDHLGKVVDVICLLVEDLADGRGPPAPA